MPDRSAGRKPEHSERRSLCRLLSTLNVASELSFPLRVTKREKPDFQVCLGQTAWGIEFTEAIPTDYAEALALAEKGDPNVLRDMSSFKFAQPKSPKEIREIINHPELTGPGFGDATRERELAEAIRCVVESKTQKLRKYKKYPRNVLLIYDNMPLPCTDHNMAAEHCAAQLKDYWSQDVVFDIIYVESGDTIFEFTSSDVQRWKVNDIWRK